MFSLKMGYVLTSPVDSSASARLESGIGLVAGVDYPRNFPELVGWFPDDAACLNYLGRLPWGQRFTSCFCGPVDGGYWRMGDGLRRCAVCRDERAVPAGTIFDRTRTPLVSWFAAVC